MPLDAADQEDAIAREGVPVHEGFDAVIRFTDGHDIQLAENRATHGGFMDAVVREDIRLAFSGCSAGWLPHGGEYERGNIARDFQYSTTALTMVAMFAMPRLPTPSATRAPGWSFDPKPEDESCECTSPGMSWMRRSGKCWRTK